MTEYAEQVMGALRRAPQFANVKTVNSIIRLGGLTNLVHRVDGDGFSVIVRIAGDGTSEYIDRTIEANNAQAAVRAGVSPEVIFVDPESGLMISETVHDIETMTAENFANRAGSAMRAGIALAKLHKSGEVFDFHFEPFKMIDEYLKILSTKEVQLPDDYDQVVKAAEPVKKALVDTDVTLAPCHCDPLCENFLDNGQVMWIVDWEYSGMADPLWDVGDLSVEAEMDAAQENEFIKAYFGREATPAEMGRIYIYKVMCDLLWTLWGLIQHADDNPAEDFWAYANGRFDRCKSLMSDPAFHNHIRAVKAS